MPKPVMYAYLLLAACFFALALLVAVVASMGPENLDKDVKNNTARSCINTSEWYRMNANYSTFEPIGWTNASEPGMDRYRFNVTDIYGKKHDGVLILKAFNEYAIAIDGEAVQ